MKLALARTIAWTLLMSGWLVLGALGRQHLPLYASGLAPVAWWMASVGLLFHAGRSVVVSGRALRWTLAVLGSMLAMALWWSMRGGVAALWVAAACWGALLVAASRAVRLLRTTSPRPPPPVASAAAGTWLAWACFGDSVVSLSPLSLAVVPGIALLLGAMLPPAAAARGCHSGLFDCALPMAAPLPWHDPAAWGALCARWTMLPMMATLVVMAQWCGGDAGITSVHWVGLHLAAMLLPPWLLLSLGRLSRAGTGSGSWATAAMAVGLILFAWLPGLRGLMAMSLCHSVAWGLAWFAAMSPTAAGRGAPAENVRVPGWAAALLPAVVVLAIGLALDRFGPTTLAAAQGGLGLVAIVGALNAWWHQHTPSSRALGPVRTLAAARLPAWRGPHRREDGDSQTRGDRKLSSDTRSAGH